jgi:chromosomal replication initiation ATPase DnaA
MRAKARELRRRIFPERKPWTTRVLELRRMADEVAALRRACSAALAMPASRSRMTADDESEDAPLGGPRPSLKAILFAVAAAFRVPVVDIVSHRRPRRICDARHAAYRIARDLTLLTLPQIGRHIGGRDHTTVLHGIRKTQALFPDLVLDPEASAANCAALMAALYRTVERGRT